MPAELLLLICLGPRIETIPTSIYGMLPFLGGANALTQHERPLRQRESSIGSRLEYVRFKTGAIGWI